MVPGLELLESLAWLSTPLEGGTAKAVLSGWSRLLRCVASGGPQTAVPLPAMSRRKYFGPLSSTGTLYGLL